MIALGDLRGDAKRKELGSLRVLGDQPIERFDHPRVRIGILPKRRQHHVDAHQMHFDIVRVQLPSPGERPQRRHPIAVFQKQLALPQEGFEIIGVILQASHHLGPQRFGPECGDAIGRPHRDDFAANAKQIAERVADRASIEHFAGFERDRDDLASGGRQKIRVFTEHASATNLFAAGQHGSRRGPELRPGGDVVRSQIAVAGHEKLAVADASGVLHLDSIFVQEQLCSVDQIQSK